MIFQITKLNEKIQLIKFFGLQSPDIEKFVWEIDTYITLVTDGICVRVDRTNSICDHSRFNSIGTLNNLDAKLYKLKSNLLFRHFNR